MSDYSIAFISNEAVTRSYANEILTENIGNNDIYVEQLNAYHFLCLILI